MLGEFEDDATSCFFFLSHCDYDYDEFSPPNGTSVRILVSNGCGGGLAAEKLQREIRRVGMCGVGFMGWVVSILSTGF